ATNSAGGGGDPPPDAGDDPRVWLGGARRTSGEGGDPGRACCVLSGPGRGGGTSTGRSTTPALVGPIRTRIRQSSRCTALVEIAGHLVISPRTVNHHTTSLYSKLGVSSRAAATRYALEHHLL